MYCNALTAGACRSSRSTVKSSTSTIEVTIRPNGERPVLHLIGASRELRIEDVDLSVIAKADFLHLGGTPLMEQFDGEPASRILSLPKSTA
jgi:sugar/nucleoside kinase (ribokinase family)